MQVHYPAIIEAAGDGYSVYFPDLPGCVSAGDTVEEAFDGATEALGLHLAGMVEDGEDLPAPTPYTAVVPDPESRVIAIVLVPAPMPGRTVRINVTLDEGLVKMIDAVSANRSAFLADAAREALSRRRH